MRRIILIFILALTSIFVTAQTTQYEVNESISIPINNDLCDEFEDFLVEYKKAGLPLEELRKIKGIYYNIALQHEGLFGIVPVFSGIVFITTDIPPYTPTITKGVLWHELGHILMPPIMHKPGGPYITRPGGLINIEFMIAAWPALKDDYMQALKKYLNDNTKKDSIRYLGAIKY